MRPSLKLILLWTLAVAAKLAARVEMTQVEVFRSGEGG